MRPERAFEHNNGMPIACKFERKSRSGKSAADGNGRKGLNHSGPPSSR
jgi:hypothetical protein